jgi:hypothetical protein
MADISVIELFGQLRKSQVAPPLPRALRATSTAFEMNSWLDKSAVGSSGSMNCMNLNASLSLMTTLGPRRSP